MSTGRSSETRAAVAKYSLERVRIVHDLHRAPAEDVRRPHSTG